MGYEKGATALAVIADMRTVVAALAASELSATANSLGVAIDALEEATRWIVETFPKNPNAVFAVAVPYLKLFGTVGGGWMMARAAQVSQRKRNEAGADTAFYDTKLATVRFYAEHILPQALAYKQTVVNGAGSVMALAESQF